MPESRVEIDAGYYDVVYSIRSSIGIGVQRIGEKGICRFCGCNDAKKFKKNAHTFPEALGNKWVFSDDECDDCNEKFSLYEGALAEALAPLLTLGGVKGKDNAIRQTGRSTGPAVLSRRRQSSGQSTIFCEVKLDNMESFVGCDNSGRLHLNIPVVGPRFRPRHAYKALCKMAFGIMPKEETKNFSSLRDWILKKDDALDFNVLDVSISIGPLEKAIPYVSGTLLKRRPAFDHIPYMLFVCTIGPICMIIDVMSDSLDDKVPPLVLGAINLKFRSIICDENGGPPIIINYVNKRNYNWCSAELSDNQIRSISVTYDTILNEWSFYPE